jgi:hypothetical protein
MHPVVDLPRIFYLFYRTRMNYTLHINSIKKIKSKSCQTPSWKLKNRTNKFLVADGELQLGKVDGLHDFLGQEIHAVLCMTGNYIQGPQAVPNRQD